jgi:predicted HD phosphohydrolase
MTAAASPLSSASEQLRPDDDQAAAGVSLVLRIVDASERRIMSLFQDFGDNDYIGEAFSITEHSVQTAAAARAAGESEEAVLACLLHDVGHLLGLEAAPDGIETRMDGCGTPEHERVGAVFLGQLGFSDTVSYLALHHVNAKRYRCAREPVCFVLALSLVVHACARAPPRH